MPVLTRRLLNGSVYRKRHLSDNSARRVKKHMTSRRASDEKWHLKLSHFQGVHASTLAVADQRLAPIFEMPPYSETGYVNWMDLTPSRCPAIGCIDRMRTPTGVPEAASLISASFATATGAPYSNHERAVQCSSVILHLCQAHITGGLLRCGLCPRSTR